jgi:hypothetical protein
MGSTVALTNNGMGVIGEGSSFANTASSTCAVTYDFVNQGALTASGNFTNGGTFTGPATLPRGQVQAAGYPMNSGPGSAHPSLAWRPAAKPSRAARWHLPAHSSIIHAGPQCAAQRKALIAARPKRVSAPRQALG